MVNLHKPVTVSLTDGDALSVRALLFGEMLKRAVSVVQFYRSDLYHDVLWMQHNVFPEDIQTPMDFDWIVRQSGTHIGEMAAVSMESIERHRTSMVFYNIRVHQHPRHETWLATFTRLTASDVAARRLTRSAVSV